MGFDPVSPARVDFSDRASPQAPDFGDVYHARAGGLGQARHVFLAGNGLPERWGGRDRFVVLETGFGLGTNFLATWAAWRDDPRRCGRLWFVSVEKHPLSRADLEQAHRGSPRPELAHALIDAWPPATPDMHLIDFDQGQVRLLLVFADIAQAMPELVVQADAIYLDGFSPARNPAMWDARVLRSLNRLAAPQATVATWSVARSVLEGLTSAGFEVGKQPGFAGKREMTVGRFAPRHRAPLPPGRRPGTARHVAVVGAGLAGAGIAQALARTGVHTAVFERRPLAADEGSGNAGGLYHGVVHDDDGPHARWLRAAALRAQRVYAPLIDSGIVPGARAGLLRAEARRDWPHMVATLARLGLPTEFAQALNAAQAATRSTWACGLPAWWLPGAGWIAPRALAQHWLGHTGIDLHLGCTVASIQPCDEGWRLLDPDGALLHTTQAVVLANAADAVRLLGEAPGPWQRTRGQVSLWDSEHPPLPVPVAGAGYALQLDDARLLFGATSQVDDLDPDVRPEDHRSNATALQGLIGWCPAASGMPGWPGRVGWRLQTADRLPWVGPAPTRQPGPAARLDQARFIARQDGLYVLAGLGSRGLTLAPLAAELLASWITGEPLPVPARMVDAVDVARFAARSARVGRFGGA